MKRFAIVSLLFSSVAFAGYDMQCVEKNGVSAVCQATHQVVATYTISEPMRRGKVVNFCETQGNAEARAKRWGNASHDMYTVEVQPCK